MMEECSTAGTDVAQALARERDALVCAIGAGDRALVTQLGRTHCGCEQGPAWRLGWDAALLPLRLHTATRGADAGILRMLGPAACAALNQAIGAHVLQWVPGRARVVPDRVLVRVTMDHKRGNGHANTDWNVDEATKEPLPARIKGPQRKRPAGGEVWMRFRPKPGLSPRQRQLRYWSTLLHECVHALGLEHMPRRPEWSGEVMYPCTGGSRVPVCAPGTEHALISDPTELPPLRDSPYVMRALRWVYANPVQHGSEAGAHQAKGKPAYCKRCKAPTWLWL